MTTGNADALALTDGVALNAAVTAQNTAVHVDEITRFGAVAGVFPDETGVSAVGNKADILTVGLVGIGKAGAAGNFPDLFLGVTAQRQAQVGQLVLGQGIEHIALILLLGNALFQQPAAVFAPLDTGIVTVPTT